MQLTFNIAKTSAYVFGQLSNMQRFAALHPVISKIEHTGGNRYLVYETLKLEFIPISFTYPASITANPETHTIMMKATVMRLAHLEMAFSVEPLNGHSIVNETVSIRSALPLHVSVLSTIRKQHTLLFENMSKAK